MKRKGSLNISIETIVIVVIAFTVLGLGLGFVRTQLGDVGKTASSIQEQISQQILDDLRTGNKKLSFPATKLTLETGEESVQAIGVKNTEDATVELKIGFKVKSGDLFEPFVSEEVRTFTAGENDVKAKIVWDNSIQTLKPGESKVFPITVTAPDKTGNYLYKIIVNRVGEGGAEEGEEFDSKTFFIKTS